MPRTTVTGAYDGGTFGALERVAEHVARRGEAPLQCFWRIAARRAVLCAGALERLLAFAGQRPAGGDAGRGGPRLPQPLGGGAAAGGGLHRLRRRLAHGGATSPAAGVEVAALVDARPGAPVPPGPWRSLAGAEVVAAHGWREPARDQRAAGGPGRAAGRRLPGGGRRLEPDAAPDLATSARRPVWDEALAAFVPAPGAVPGAGGGRRGGRRPSRPAAALAGRRGRRRRGARRPRLPGAAPEVPEAEDAPAAAGRLWQVAGGRGRAWLDLQNDVTVKDVALAAREDFRSAEHMKRYTTLGMATDQGKTGGVAGARASWPS